MLFTMFLSLYISRLILQNLGVIDYGVYGVVGSIVTIFSFFNMAMVTAGQRCLSMEIGRENTKYSTILGTLIVISLIICIFIILILELFAGHFLNELNIPENRMGLAKLIFHASCLSLFFNTLQIPFSASLISQERIGIYSMINVSDVVLRFILAFSLQYFLMEKLLVYAFGISIITFVLLGLTVFLSLKQTKVIFELKYAYFKEVGSFFGWNLLGGLASVSLYQGLQIIINIFFNPVLNAAQTITLQVKSAVESLAANIRTATNPQIIKHCANNNISQIMELLSFSMKLSTIVILILAVPLCFRIEYILKIWLGKPPAYTDVFIVLFLINAIIDVVSSPLVTVIQAIGNLKKYQIITSLIIIGIIPSTYVSYSLGAPPQFYGYILIFTTLLILVIRVLFIRNIIKVNRHEFYKSISVQIILLPLICFSIIGLLNIYIPNNFTGLLTLIFCSLLSVIFFSYYLLFSIIEKNTLKAYINNRFR